MRTAVAVAVAGLVLTGCSGPSTATTPAGCGLVPSSQVVGLIGKSVDASLEGSMHGLREAHRTVTCRSTVPGHPERYVTIRAEYHPEPLRLPPKACAEGWVYAGTPGKYSPACQETVDGHGRTQLVARWQPYVMRVTVGRRDLDWAGDPETALAMSRVVARRLGVTEAASDR
jgi:hypothetical protein